MSAALRNAFAEDKKNGKTSFVAYMTCGYPRKEDTVPALLALQKGGASVIEIGVPFSDPLGDGPTIQASTFTALTNGVKVDDCFDALKEARKQGLTVPVIFMGYYNPVVQYGEERFVKAIKEAGGHGTIVVDLPIGREARSLMTACRTHDVALVPLVTPTTEKSRLPLICQAATGFLYVVALSGVTGARAELPPDLVDYLDRVKSETVKTGTPIAVGFGISSREQFLTVGKLADGVVIGSAIVRTLFAALEEGKEPAAAAEAFARSITQD
mmetsp:Transcript_14442/g.56791  ORF Transcript_14442/g.56791 Transcript_14442/m.56791 type:complete len:270 (+) Transcript_14442:41-850(+)